MTIIEWIFIGGIAIAILCFLFAAWSFIQYSRRSKELKKLPNRRIKNKKKRKRLMQRRQFLTASKKRGFRLFFLFTLLGLLAGGGSGYAKYYQSMNLTSDDSEAIVKSYYLLRDFQEQLQMAGEEQDEREKLERNIRYLASSMASYGTKTASNLNTQEGQLALNRYYNAIKELGMNGSTNTQKFYGDPELVTDFTTDIDKVIGYEKIVFEFYKVNEDALQQEQ